MRYHLRSALALLFLAGCNIDRVDAPQTFLTAPRSIIATPDPVPDPCSLCVFGPTSLERHERAPVTETFPLNVGPGTYIIDLDDLGSQGADGVVRLGDMVLLSARAPGEVGPRHVQLSLELSGEETFEVRLTGKPGSQLRVAIWRTVFVEILPTTFFPQQLVLEGGDHSYFPYLMNHTGDLTDVTMRVWLRQGTASRAAGTQPVLCGGGIPGGSLPFGICLGQQTVFASNSSAGTGTLVYGSATAVIEAVQTLGSGAVILASIEFPVQIVPIPVVHSVTVSPKRSLIAVAATLQMTATVQVSGGAPTSVGWQSQHPAVGTVNSNGVVTGVSAGIAQIWSWSDFDPTKLDFGYVNVYNPLAPLPFQFSMIEPSSNVTVHRDDAGAPSVTLKATAVGPTGIFTPFTNPVEFWIRTTGGPWTPISGTIDVIVADNGVNRTITYTMSWDPDATTAPFANPSTTSLEVIAAGLRFGIPLVTTTSKQLTLVVP